DDEVAYVGEHVRDAEQDRTEGEQDDGQDGRADEADDEREQRTEADPQLSVPHEEPTEAAESDEERSARLVERRPHVIEHFPGGPRCGPPAHAHHAARSKSRSAFETSRPPSRQRFMASATASATYASR